MEKKSNYNKVTDAYFQENLEFYVYIACKLWYYFSVI